MPRLDVAGILAVLAIAPCPLIAQEAAASPRPRAEVHESLGSGVNPLGLQNGLDVAWRWPLSRSRRPLLADAHASVGLADRLSPAYNRLGAFVEIAPLSVLDVRLGVEPVLYFGTFSAMLGFPGYDAPFGDAALDVLRAHGRAVSGLGGRAYVAPTVKGRVGRLVARAHAELEWWRAEQPGAAFFYEPARDTLLDARGDRMVWTETLVAYVLDDRPGHKTLIGPVHTLTRVWRAPGNQKQDLGLLAVVGVGAKRLGASEPTLFAKVFCYLQDPHRRGQVGAQLAIGFGVGR
jgi:hypothetical protein